MTEAWERYCVALVDAARREVKAADVQLRAAEGLLREATAERLSRKSSDSSSTGGEL